MKLKKIIIIGSIVIIVCLVAVIQLNPLRRDEASIRQKLLENTPIGTNAEDVLKYIKNSIKPSNQNIRYDEVNPASLPGHVPTGQKNVTVALGKYWSWEQFSNFDLPLITYVFAGWAFNNNNQLIDILVYKENDGL
ncbi:MAG: hypothetical protein ACFFG0_57375 [Candidatus Thorarchaeota archaeon]